MMKPTVGIPRSLLYFHYYPAWRTFFAELGVEVIESDPTNKLTVDQGVRLTVDEACLPVKVCHGHIVNLCSKVDYIFLPRIVSIVKHEYVCPKLIGLPDMIRNNIPDHPQLLTPTINRNRGWWQLFKVNLELGSIFTDNKLQIMKAHLKARQSLQEHRQSLLKSPAEDKLVVALLGHSYLLNDDHLNLGLLDKLRDLGVEVITPQNLTTKQIQAGADQLNKPLFWSFNQRIIGTAYYLFEEGAVDGFIQLAAFGCGPDSIVGELVERKAKRRADIHFMLLNLDEHTGEAGLQTRLEAFVDMLKWEVQGA